MKVLFIGGTGVISSACTVLALEKDIELYLLNRGKSTMSVPVGANVIHGDIRDVDAVNKALGDMKFDVVVNFIAFSPEHIENDLKLFRGKMGQYIFISSASAYQTPPITLPVTESTPLYNPYWSYSQAKISCEERLMKAFREEKFPVTIVRPSHTYNRTMLPVKGGYTAVDRMRKGKPVIVHGDGTSIWVLTHNSDFAKGLVGLLGNEKAIGEAFHITSDELLSWNRIYELVAKAAGTEAKIVHIPSDVIARYNPEWGASLLGDKAHSMIFDNSKIKQLVPEYNATIPFSSGVEEIISWFDADPTRQVIDSELDRQMDEMIGKYGE